MRLGRLSALCGWLAVALMACVDTSPLDFSLPSRDAGPDDATLVPADVRSGCRECVTTGACKKDYDACTENARCVIFSDCLFEVGCFSLPELQDRIACGTPCFEKSGIVSGVDPAITLAYPLNICTYPPGGPCAAACVPQ